MYEHPSGFECEDVDDRCGDLEQAVAELSRDLVTAKALANRYRDAYHELLQESIVTDNA